MGTRSRWEHTRNSCCKVLCMLGSPRCSSHLPAAMPPTRRPADRQGAARPDPWGAVLLVNETLGLQRFLHLGPMPHSREIGRECVILGKVDCEVLGPAEHGEQIRIGHRELIAHQVALVPEISG